MEIEGTGAGFTIFSGAVCWGYADTVLISINGTSRSIVASTVRVVVLVIVVEATATKCKVPSGLAFEVLVDSDSQFPCLAQSACGPCPGLRDGSGLGSGFDAVLLLYASGSLISSPQTSGCIHRSLRVPCLK